MHEGAASRTAVSAALMRAAHSRRDHPRLIDDPWADRLVSAAEKTTLWQRVMDGASADTKRRLERLSSEQDVIDAAMRAHPTYGGVIIRTRYAEDALERAVAAGARQYVVIGAGLDSFIVRQPAFARELAIFEIDHPATQAMKRERLAACGATILANVHFVASDLSQESLSAALMRSAFSPSVPAFFSWLGVTIYLTREANLATLRGVAMAAASASEIVFNYTDQRAFEIQSDRLQRMRDSVAAMGEPWVSGFDPATLAKDLQALGLDLVEDLGFADLRERYCAGRTDNLAPGMLSHIARARAA
jgi:methyltransferase (TIGR00027 family)